MTTLDKKARIIGVVGDWASNLTNAGHLSHRETKELVGLIVAEIEAMEYEENMKLAEANVSTFPKEADANNA